MKPLLIGNAQAFWGDSPEAPQRLVAQAPELDFLTLDYLAEVSLSIMALQRSHDPHAGYAQDFVNVIRSLVPLWKSGSKVRVVTNAGGLNPVECARACSSVLKESGLEEKTIHVVTGDDVSSQVLEAAASDSEDFAHLDTGCRIAELNGRILTANAYLGAAAVAEAILAGAQIVITGRVADPSLTVAPCLAHFDWPLDDYDRLAAATVAGHLIECGTQVTGGYLTDWLELRNNLDIGFPLVEVHADGSFAVTKPPCTGGEVSLRSVKEQLLYEIGDPGNYLSPDVVVSLLSIQLQEEGTDRIRVVGASGMPPKETLKVGVTYREGFKAHGMLAVFGKNAVPKAKRCAEVVLGRLDRAGCRPARSLVECLGTGTSLPGVALDQPELLETVLRIGVADPRREVVEKFSMEMASLITCGPAGVSGYAYGRPKVQEVFGFWPCLIDRHEVNSVVQVV